MRVRWVVSRMVRHVGARGDSGGVGVVQVQVRLGWFRCVCVCVCGGGGEQSGNIRGVQRGNIMGERLTESFCNLRKFRLRKPVIRLTIASQNFRIFS